MALAPNLPTLAEQGLTDFEATIWSGLMAPAGTPQDIVDKLARATDTATASADAIAALRGQGITMRGGGPEPFPAIWRARSEMAHGRRGRGHDEVTARALTGSAVSCQG